MNERTLELNNFDSGLISNIASDIIPDNAFCDCANIEFSDKKVVISSKGNELFPLTTSHTPINDGRIRGIAIYKFYNTGTMVATPLMVIVYDNILLYCDLVQKNKQFNVIQGADGKPIELEPNAKIKFAQYSNTLYFVTGIYPVAKNLQGAIGVINNTMATTISSEKLNGAKYISVFQDRLFVASVASSPNSIYWSVAYDPSNWSSQIELNTNTITTDDGDFITGLIPFNELYMYVFKRFSTHRIFTQNFLWYSQKLDMDYGCMFEDTIANIKNKLFFFSGRGIISFDGNSGNVISDPVKDKLNFNMKNIVENLVSASASKNDNFDALPSTGEKLTNLVFTSKSVQPLQNIVIGKVATDNLENKDFINYTDDIKNCTVKLESIFSKDFPDDNDEYDDRWSTYGVSPKLDTKSPFIHLKEDERTSSKLRIELQRKVVEIGRISFYYRHTAGGTLTNKSAKLYVSVLEGGEYKIVGVWLIYNVQERAGVERLKYDERIDISLNTSNIIDANISTIYVYIELDLGESYDDGNFFDFYFMEANNYGTALISVFEESRRFDPLKCKLRLKDRFITTNKESYYISHSIPLEDKYGHDFSGLDIYGACKYTGFVVYLTTSDDFDDTSFEKISDNDKYMFTITYESITSNGGHVFVSRSNLINKNNTAIVMKKYFRFGFNNSDGSAFLIEKICINFADTGSKYVSPALNLSGKQIVRYNKFLCTMSKIDSANTPKFYIRIAENEASLVSGTTYEVFNDKPVPNGGNLQEDSKRFMQFIVDFPFGSSTTITSLSLYYIITQDFDLEVYDRPTAIGFEDKYVLEVKQSEKEFFELIYDDRYGVWTERNKFPQEKALYSANLYNDTEDILFKACRDSATILKENESYTYGINGNPDHYSYTSYFITKKIMLTNIENTFRYIKLTYKSLNPITILVSIDNKSFNDTDILTLTYSPSNVVTEVKKTLLGIQRGQFIQLKVMWTANAYTEVHGILIGWNPLRELNEQGNNNVV